MKRIQLEIKALSPLAIGRKKPGGSVSEAADYIPGSVIRGAIATQILRQSGHQSANLADNGGDFQSLFIGDNPAIFYNAYPATIERPKQIIVQSDVRVVPATALSSKREPGFCRPNQNQKCTGDGNGVFDTLIDRFCAEGYGYLYDPNCPTDGDRVDTFTGYYSKIGNKYYSHSTNTRLLTRVGINRRRSTAQEGVLYSIEVLNESQIVGKKEKPVIYTGAILVADELAESLQSFITHHQQDFRLGGSTSRGLGKVKITANSPVDTTAVKPSVDERIKMFQDKLHKRWQDWQIFGQPQQDLLQNRTYFTIDLQSDTILNENWRRTTVILPEMLQYFIGVTDSSLQLHAAYSSYDYLSGWNSAWGLMKDVELITNKGAVYLFSTIQPNLWIERLEYLEVKGVGDRTCEGFGQVQICNEFHLVLREEAV